MQILKNIPINKAKGGIMKTKEFNVLENRAKCMNGVHSFINAVVPKLIKELEKGFKLN